VAAPKKYPDELRARAVRLYRESEPKLVIFGSWTSPSRPTTGGWRRPRSRVSGTRSTGADPALPSD